MKFKIEEIEMSIRLKNVLLNSGFIYLEEMFNYTEDDYMRIRNLGRKNLEEVRNIVIEYKNKLNEGDIKMTNLNNEALVIVDMSNDFVADNGSLTAGKPAQEIVPYILEQANKFLANGGTVVVAMDAHQENDPHFELWPVHNVSGTEGQKLYGELYDWYNEDNNLRNENIIYLPKTNYNSFFNTNLADQLRSKGIEKVHVTGVCTDICDFLTVAGADAEGFKTAIHKRGAATFTDLGETMINHMKLCFHTEIVE